MCYMEKDKKRFHSYYKIIDGCFVWQNYLDKDGYGTFYLRKRARRAHRVAYYFANGDIPKDMVIDHICKVRNCVNTDHLRLVTQKENTMNNSNSIGAVNARKIFCNYGHPFDRKYGKQRYCSICSAEKSKRLHKKWRAEADLILC